jgi:pyruvate dehydrogenase E1 component
MMSLRAPRTDYVNTIPVDEQPEYPGDLDVENRIKSLVRWNAMAMVVRANRETPGLGGHISSYASAATLFEVGFQHFWRARGDEHPGDLVYLQGHASPGVYARAFLEGRLDEQRLTNFRRELASGGGLSSYPHPQLMPEFWQFPTVSMGLAPIQAIYQAHFLRHLEHRGVVEASDRRVWCVLGDGECDEPESVGALALAAREGLDNLVFVVDCNLQRLDGPVRGNGKVIQELEGVFRGAGWDVVKVVWGGDWDPILAADESGALVKRMNEACDGDYQKYWVAPGSYAREHFFDSPELASLVEHLSDDQIRKLRRGGHDPEKVYAAYRHAVANEDGPTVVLAKTVKGYGLGEAGEGRNVTHQQKKLNEEELHEFRSRFGIPLDERATDEAPFFRPAEDSREMVYLRERREALGGWLPAREEEAPALDVPAPGDLEDFLEGSGDRDVATTMALVRLLRRLLEDEAIGERIVPIVPDEARTFGMDALFHQFGIYSGVGQRYEPVDRESLLYYREARDGRILEEGITEAGSMASFIAAGTAHANLGWPAIPFFLFYSMFGFQRIGDLVWAAGDIRAKGFLCGATAGRTTLSGEGLQHQDGHSHVIAEAHPNVRAYDPAYAYEVAVIVRDGLHRLYAGGETALYYLTLYNETYPMPAMPDGAEEGILRGMHRVAPAENGSGRKRVRLLGSGPLLREALEARELLAERGVASEVWSVTSYQQLRRDALLAEREARLHPEAAGQPETHLARCLGEDDAPVVAVSDYLRLASGRIARFVPARFVPLGTDGFGRSEARGPLRRYFEVDAAHIAYAALAALGEEGVLDAQEVRAARDDLGIDPDKRNPLEA